MAVFLLYFEIIIIMFLKQPIDLDFLKSRQDGKRLQLDNLEISELPDQIAETFPLLIEIYISHNSLKKLENFNFKSLESLSAGFNELTGLCIISSPVLKQLNLQYNQITDLDVASKCIQNLNLCHNRIEKVGFISNLKELRVLNLNSNQITKVDFLIYNLKLEELYLAQNNISTLSKSLTNTANLIILDISANKISDISFIDKLPELQEFYAANNLITDIAIQKENTNLNILDLSGNQLKKIQIIEFKYPNLTHLLLSENQIEFELDFNFTKLLKELIEIDFRNNPFLTCEFEDQFIVSCPWIEVVNKREVCKPGEYVRKEIQELKTKLLELQIIDKDELPITFKESELDTELTISEERLKAMLNLCKLDNEEDYQAAPPSPKQEEKDYLDEDQFQIYITQQNEEMDKIRALYFRRMEKSLQKSSRMQTTQQEEEDILLQEALLEKHGQPIAEGWVRDSQHKPPIQAKKTQFELKKNQVIIKSGGPQQKIQHRSNILNEISQLKQCMGKKEFYQSLGFSQGGSGQKEVARQGSQQQMNLSSENFNSKGARSRSNKPHVMSAQVKLPKI